MVDGGYTGVRVDRARLEGNAAGIVAVSANGVIVRDSRLTRNAVGLVLRDVDGARVIGNTVTDNDATDVWVASPTDGAEPPSGAGIWISGGRGSLIASNTATGHTYNVAVTGPTPALEHRIMDNAVGDATHADLGLDGSGVGVCFSDNRHPSGVAPTSDPPWSAQLHDCRKPVSAAVPYPLVTTRLVAHARTAGYPT